MFDYQIPSERHKYIIGIDFGHGETSANICEIQLNDVGRVRKLPEIIELQHSQSIPSVLLIQRCDTPHGISENCVVGLEAVALYNEHLSDNSTTFHDCFKKTPSAMSPEDKKIMLYYMKGVYSLIRKSLGSRLTDDNHIVYLACPSNASVWSEADMKKYAEIALLAGMPVCRYQDFDHRVSVIRESRAAFLKASQEECVKNNIRGASCMI